MWKRRLAMLLAAALLVSMAVGPAVRCSEAAQGERPFMIGAKLGDYLARRDFGRLPRVTNPSFPLGLLKENGFNMVYAVTTMESVPNLWEKPFGPWDQRYWFCREFTQRMLSEASRAGLGLSLGFYFSETAAWAGRQIAPPAWKGYTVSQTAQALKEYTYETVKYFKDSGLKIEFYGLGSETHHGMLGFMPGDRIPIPAGVDQFSDMQYMTSKVWNVQATLLKAAAEGVRQADPHAKIMLHIAGLGLHPQEYYTITFFKTMVENGVDFDYAGISYYDWGVDPHTPYMSLKNLDEFSMAMAALGKKVVVGEFSYPSADPDPRFRHGKLVDVPGSSSTVLTEPQYPYARPAKGYPFTPQGQAEYVSDFLRFCHSDPNIAGAFYFFPDFCQTWEKDVPTGIAQCGLFETETKASPALRAFEAFSRSIDKTDSR